MLRLVLAVAEKELYLNASLLLVASSLSVLALPYIKQARRKLLFFLFLKRRTNTKKKSGRIPPLLIILGVMALLGLLFSWTIALWVLLGVAGLALLVLVFNIKPKPGKPISPEEGRRRAEKDRQDRESLEKVRREEERRRRGY